MKLDKEQKKILRAISGSSLGFIIGYPLMMWIFGKLGSWADALAWFGVGLIVAITMGVLFILGSKIPKKKNE
jgi:biotin transporter BioY